MATTQIERSSSKIIPTDTRTTWLEARKLANSSMQKIHNLPSIYAHEEALRSSQRFQLVEQGYYAAWTGDIHIYPALGKTFEKDRNVRDSKMDDEGRTWVLPSHYVPEAAIGEHGISLIVYPGFVDVHEKEEKQVIIHPYNDNVKIVRSTENEIELFGESRKLFRLNGAGVRPMVRGMFFGTEESRNYVFSDVSPSSTKYSVGYAELLRE